MTLHILVNESTAGAAEHAERVLEEHGHRVLRCHDRGTPIFPCAALRTGHVCPLECGVDVAVTVRGAPDPQPAPGEDGIACALRARIPVVVAGDVRDNPFVALGAIEADGEHVAQPCEWVAATPSPPHTAVATDALLNALRARRGDAMAVVNRERDRLHVLVEAIPGIERRTLAAAASRVLSALRRYDTHAPIIDLSIKE
jgi:hypothetical protein